MSTVLIELEQAETNRLMAMVERLQQSGAGERYIAAAVREATRSRRRSRRVRLHALVPRLARV